MANRIGAHNLVISGTDTLLQRYTLHDHLLM